MIDPVTTGIIVVLGKYALDKGAELVKEVGPLALATAKEIFTAALDRLRQEPAGQAIAQEYAADPETYEKPVAKKVAEAVQADVAFKEQMTALLNQFDQAAAAFAVQQRTTYTAVLQGDGANAQGDGATAVGAGGVNVGGNVDGPIITGSGNVINMGARSGASVSLPPTLAPLRDKLARYFNMSELKGLCFDLGVAHDDLPAETRTELAQSLVEFCYERDRLPELLTICQQERPHGAWHQV